MEKETAKVNWSWLSCQGNGRAREEGGETASAASVNWYKYKLHPWISTTFLGT